MMEATMTLEEAAAREWDALVVGAGPAGAMAALELARRGVSVLLVDKAAFPRWKACGCCLNAWGQATLAQAGLGDVAARLGGVALSHFVLSIGGRRLEMNLPHSVAISREALDNELVRAAAAMGARFLPQTPAQLGPLGMGCRKVVLRQGGSALQVAARVVLAADGLAGRLAAAEPEGGLDIDPESRLGAGVTAFCPGSDYPPGIVFMGCGRHGYVGLVRVEDGRLNLGAALNPEAVRDLGGLGAAAAATLQQSGLPAIDGLERLPWKGTPLLTRQIKAPAGERWMALGDAAGYVEPFTGEGMAWALAQGRAIAPLAADAAQGWSSEHAANWIKLYRELMRERQYRCHAVASALRHPAMTGWLVGAMTMFPWITAPVVRRFTMPQRE